MHTGYGKVRNKRARKVRIIRTLPWSVIFGSRLSIAKVRDDHPEYITIQISPIYWTVIKIGAP
ncbi:hypothetical protein RSAG8_08055, partial [Rhizoctonia solani AG-8 WAC10335]